MYNFAESFRLEKQLQKSFKIAKKDRGNPFSVLTIECF